MNSYRLIGLLCLLGLFPGCTTTPTAPTAAQEQVAAVVEDVLAVGLVPVLAKNPAIIPDLRTASALLLGFTPADVAAFVARLKLAPDDARAMTGLLNAAWDTYQRRYMEKVGQAVRPDVVLFLRAVGNGIERAIAAVPKP